MSSKRRAFLLILALAIVAAPSPADDETEREFLRGAVEQIAAGLNPRIGDATIASVHVIPRLYEARSFRLAWNNPNNVEELIGRIEDSYGDGLDPEDYHLSTLRALLAETESSDSPGLRAALDIVLTDGLARLGYHLFFGKVNPEALDADWNFKRSLDGRNPVDLLQAAIDAPSLRKYLDDRTGYGPVYERLKAALAEYRGYKTRGGWSTLPTGPTLKPGMEDPRVATLRERLRVTGHLGPANGSNPSSFDRELEEAVKQFQESHRLETDGAVGPETLEALNVTVDQRIDQIRVNLERARWVMRGLSDDFVVVNIAGFRVWLFRNREPVWTARAQVGKPYRMTPVFTAAMKYMVFNPTWTVPPGILSKDILPKLKADPGYLARKHMRVIDGAGKSVDPASIDWSAVSARNFRYQIRQDPGSWNALGQVKFIFPNSHFVFLHDTPSKALFERRDRSFSSGCIRTENPLELAEHLLKDPEQWNAESIRTVLDSQQPRTLYLPEPMHVLLLYFTVGVGDPGSVRFLRDIYNRDPRVLEELDGEFRFDLPQELREVLG